MTRLLSFTAAAVFILTLWMLTLWVTCSEPIDPALWREYSMTDLRGH